MSIEIVEDDIKKAHIQGGGFRGQSVHEHASTQLLYSYVITEKELENGQIETTKEIDVDARTELPSPANTGVLEFYSGYLDKAFGLGRGKGMIFVSQRYKINQISKNRKGRLEFTQVATASALTSDSGKDKNIIKAVQES